MKLDNIIQLGAMTIGGAAAGFAFSALMKLGIRQDPLFALLGALIGACATVGGAAWLADRARAVERDAETSLLITECNNLLGKAVATQKSEPALNELWPKAYRPLLSQLSETAGDTRVILLEALAHARALNFVQRAALRRVEFAIEEYLQFWSDANAEGDLDPLDDRSFPGVTEEIIRECRGAIERLSGATAKS